MRLAKLQDIVRQIGAENVLIKPTGVCCTYRGERLWLNTWMTAEEIDSIIRLAGRHKKNRNAFT